MTTLPAVHYGKVFTHLIELLGQVETALASGDVPLPQIASRLDSDPVYIAIAAELFVSPVRQGPKSGALRAKIENIRQLIADSEIKRKTLELFLEPIEKFLGSGGSEWQRKYGYFIVPVIDTEGQAGMVYLHSPRKLRMSHASRWHLDIEDLTQDDKLLDYFDSLAHVLLKRFFFVRHYPFDPYTGLKDFSYRLHFGCQITKGKSVGAAALAMCLLNFLQGKLGDEAYTRFVAPQVGTLLTGEIDPQGRVLPVNGLEQKVRCAVEEYGPELKVIVPDGALLPTYLEKRINSGNLFYVGSVEELMGAVLSTRGSELRGLDKAREEVFASLLPEEIAELLPYLLPNVPRDIYVRKRAWRGPVPHEQGIYSLTNAWNDRLDINFGPDAFSLASDNAGATQGEKLIQVILDGGAAMDGHWAIEPPHEVSRIAIALYQIARRIDPAKETLVIGFLGSQHFEPYKYDQYRDAKLLDPLLQERRKKLGLRRRGPFMRPVRQQSMALYADQRKRIYVLSESDIPDLHDVDDRRFESLELLRLTPKQGTAEQAIFSEELKPDQELLSRHFYKKAATLPEVAIDLGADLPITWEPATATVSREDDRYVLRCRDDEAIQWKFRVRLANQYPHRIAVSGVINRDGQAVDYSFTAFPTVTALPPLPSWRAGQLTAAECELWKIISAPESACPECHSQTVHLLHESRHGLTDELIFPSLAELKQGWLLLCAAQPQWVFFKTGCQIAGLSIAEVDKKLRYSTAAGYLEPIPAAPEGGGLYCLQHEHGEVNHTFYLTRII